ncbi:MAG: protein kinase [Bryobacteraceae bacterium]
MSPAQWERAKDLFETALDLPLEEREAFVRRSSDGDETLCKELLRLLAQHDAAESFFRTPMFDLNPHTVTHSDGVQGPGELHFALRAGETVCGRFDVRRFIGQGGMGEVYEARDRLLNVTVALKTIRGSLGIKGGARFRNEVQLARNVTHRNACRIHDLFRYRTEASDGLPARDVEFLSMEFLDGETLSERVQRCGRLAPEEALTIARQIAEGLAAVHRARIVHRDLKPSNIILAKSANEPPNAVITDFGLATGGFSEDARIPGSEIAGGTPAYMAPEQLEGGPATAASDIYAFGMICYEILTGENPHSASNLAEMAVRRLREPLAPLSDLVSRIDTGAEKAIMRCLERDPKARFDSIEEFIRALDGASAGRRTGLRLNRAQWVVAATIFLVVVALFAVWRRYLNQTATIPSASSVLLTHLRSSDPELSGVTEALRSQLAQSAHFSLLEDRQVQATLREMLRPPGQTMDAETAREVALRDGAAVVIFGGVEAMGEKYILRLDVERVGGTPLLARRSWKQDFAASTRQDLLATVRQAAIWVRGSVGESGQGLAEQDRAPEDTSTSSWKALRLYSGALQADSENKPEGALILLGEALREDPRFAMAKMRQADILISQGRYAEGYRAWGEAKDLAESSELTSREQLRITGQYYEDTGDTVRAERAYRAYALHYPNDFLAIFFVGSALQDLAHDEEAISWFQRAAALRPTETAPISHIAYADIDLGRFQEALALASRVRTMGKPGWGLWLESWSAFAQGNLERALQLAAGFESLDPVWRSHGYSIRACWLGEEGRLREAAAQLREGIAFDTANGLHESEADKQIQLGWVSYRLRDFEACSEACLRSFELEPSATRAMQAGSVLAQAGKRELARDMLLRVNEGPDIPKVRMARLRLEGEIALAAGRTEIASGKFENAAKLAPPSAPRDFLARSFVRSGRPSDALAVYEEVLRHPARLYRDPERGLPGSWTMLLQNAAKIAESLHAANADALQLRFAAAATHADPGAFSQPTPSNAKH